MLADGFTLCGLDCILDELEANELFLPPMTPINTDESGRFEFLSVSIGVHRWQKSDHNSLVRDYSLEIFDAD